MLYSFDAICIGDAKIDIFLMLPQDSSFVHVDKEKNLCLMYGQKIPVEKGSLMLGGNACNVSVGLTKLSIKTALIAEIGEDEFSQRIINGLEKENVNTDFLIQKIENSSSFSVILSYKQDRTVLGQHRLRQHNFSFEDLETKLVYLTSLGNTWETAYRKTLEFTKKTKSVFAFNPGTPQLEKGLDGIREILESTDILFVNKEETKEILKENTNDIKYLLESLQKLGPKTAVITDGENGSFAINGKRELFSQPIIKTEIVEKTGAGDAYASGFLSATLLNYPILTAMRWGALNASGTMTAIGAQNGLLSKKGMEETYVKQAWL